MLLTGPVGSGKTASIRCVCNNLEVNLTEYENSLNHNVFSSSIKSENEFLFNDIDYLPLSHKLIETIQGCGSKKQRLSISKENAPKPVKKIQSIFLLEDLPSYSILTSAAVQNSFRSYLNGTMATSAIVIILSDSISRNIEYGESLISKRNVLPSDVLQSNRVSEIKFNPIAKTLFIKGVKRIFNSESGNLKFKKLSNDFFEQLVNFSQGDIRIAITNLQFMNQTTYSKTKKIVCPSPESENMVSLFHLLGKILHNKRHHGKMSSIENELNPSLIKHKRDSIAFNPEKMFCDLQLDSISFSLYLNQNYTNHCINLDEVVSISAYLSISDILNSSYVYRSLFDEYSSSIAMRGVLFSLNHAANLPKYFKAFMKSENWASEKKRLDYELQWKEVKKYFIFNISDLGFFTRKKS